MAQSNQKVVVELTNDERTELETLARKSSAPATQVRNARVLLLADQDRRDGRHPDRFIREQTGLSLKQISRVRKRFAENGLDSAIFRKPRLTPPTPPKLDGRQEARLVQLCCSTPPAGRQRWTLRLLADELCRLEVVVSICPETVRKCLKKTGCSLGGPNASAFLRKTAPASWRTWSRSSTSTTNRSMRHIR